MKVSLFIPTIVVVVILGNCSFSLAEDSLERLLPHDLYLLEGPQQVVALPDGSGAAVINRRIDPLSQQELWSLRWSDAHGDRLLESKEYDARTITFSPHGKWIAVRSSRPLPAGWKQIPETPPQSDAATDIWLISVDAKQAFPLAGPDKPYGRVFQDPFYGRVSFSKDGKRIAFVADDGADPRTKAEIDADVVVVRPDQGEGYTGFGTAQVWVAELKDSFDTYAAKSIRRLTNDSTWYGDPQWTPDGQTLIVHANKSDDVEAVRYSINKNYDLWAIDVDSGAQRQLTFGPGPEVSPRISPVGDRLVCLSSPRKGPHADIYNLLVVELAKKQPSSRVLYDHHAKSSGEPPHAIPTFPLPESCWEDDNTMIYTSYSGVLSRMNRVNLTDAKGAELILDIESDAANKSPLIQQLLVQRRFTPAANEVLLKRLQAVEQIVEWENEGFNLDGMLLIPPKSVAQPPYPLVLFPHGGPHSRSSQGFNFSAQVFANAGYAVYQPNFRGSAGYGKEFLDADQNDLGGGDMRDILAGIEQLAKEKIIDPERQFVYGVSYGGFMTSWLVGHTRQFRAAVAQNAVTEMNAMWGLSDIQSWTQHELGGLPWEVAEKMHKHSPFAYAQHVETPTLILHSRDDRRCPLPMGQMFYQALVAKGVPTQMVIYPDEGHGIRQPKHQVDVLERTLAWFAKYDPAREAAPADK